MFGEIVSSSHSYGGSNYHLQFTPKYRRGVFVDKDIRKACEEVFKEIAKELGVSIYALKFGPDHAHLFVGNCRKYSVSQLVQRFKGASSRILRKEHGDRIKSKLRGDSFLSDGYFYESIGRVTAESVEYYIQKQQGKHWAGLAYEVQQARRKGQTKLDDFAS